jgi:hypothetical protein
MSGVDKSGRRGRVKKNDLFLNFTNNRENNPQIMTISGAVDVKSLGALALRALNWGAVSFRLILRAG